MAPQKQIQTPKPKEPVRQRRAHQKSRRGCRNCKLRKVKCDETRPKCQKCISFGVTCNYDAKTSSDLQPSYDKQVILTVESPCTNPKVSIRPALQPLITIEDEMSSFELDAESLGRLERFKKRTIGTIGTKSVAHIFGQLAFELCFAHPYLMHVVQVLTACHDRHLSPNPFSKQTLIENYHMSRAAALFNRKLSGPIRHQDRDGLWATAALLGLLAYALTDASNPEEAWPLADSPDCDPLEWITIAESKTAIWNLVNPLREDSKFAVMKDAYKQTITPFKVPLSGNEGIPLQFVELFGLDEWVTAKVNPYYTAVHILIPLLPIPCERENVVRFLTFMGHMEEGFKDLLRVRDPRALLLVAYFYAKVWKSTWWMERRAILECEAICLYLERFHADNKLLQEMLMVPKRKCGLAREVQWIADEELLLVRVTSEPDQPFPLPFVGLNETGGPNQQLGWGWEPC